MWTAPTANRLDWFTRRRNVWNSINIQIDWINCLFTAFAFHRKKQIPCGRQSRYCLRLVPLNMQIKFIENESKTKIKHRKKAPIIAEAKKKERMHGIVSVKSITRVEKLFFFLSIHIKTTLKLGVFLSKYNSLVSHGPDNCPMSDVVWNLLVLYSLVQWWIRFFYFFHFTQWQWLKKAEPFDMRLYWFNFFSRPFPLSVRKIKMLFLSKVLLSLGYYLTTIYQRKKRGKIIIQFNIPSVWWENGQKITQTHPMSLRIVYFFFHSEVLGKQVCA